MENDHMMQSRSSARSRIPTGLREMNPASTNARSGLLQPGTIAGAVTSKSTSLSQPSRPRSTTQAPEVGRAGAGAASSRVNSTTRVHTRANSHSSSTLTRSATTSTRSKGTISGVPHARPHTSMSRSHSVASSRRPNGHGIPRPATSLDTHDEEDSAATVLGKRKGAEWDQESREKTMEDLMNTFVTKMSQAGQESTGMKEALDLYKSRVSELEASRKEITDMNLTLRVEMESLKVRLGASEDALKDAQREHEMEIDEIGSRQRRELESVRFDGRRELESLASQHQEEIRELKRRFEHELEDERAARLREISQMTSQTAIDTQKSNMELDKKEREIATLRDDMQALRAELERERKSNRDLRQNLDTASSNSVTLESSVRALKARIEFLESGREEQSQAFERLNQQMMDALAETNATKDKLRKEETLRRKLHNQVQELKGNIRVFCRVRPSLPSDPATGSAQIEYPDEAEDSKEIAVLGPEEKSSLGTITRKNSNFSFDRVFGPSTQNAEVFDEISQLVQSALDGYNVCIFCYGQTGSGKTYTMSSLDGMIPRAVHQIYETATGLEEKGWRYTMEGNFVEVYNENLNDLLGNPEELDKKKLEIRHDMQRGKTIITDVTTVRLESPEMVETILKRAASNRSVAATKANERSSRSHSVFILKLIGENDITGERSEGTLNLVDLAGSERLSHSGATGERLKETQNINRSLSCLGDVIAALGQGKEGGHIPYRNSKLTYLLQFSLGGNSKTLMFVMVSPLQAHLAETLTSLKFATKVHNTHIGTAKRQARVRDS
ncbi:kinesin-domain-containing protein [Aspergillus welwitschiae]|uniref:Kinesin-like protein n=1 Tax=Aspergillus welwitschiae TaxID=1341132 RepID=A0A3F3PZ83_9EURO|nr:kinesin-domain-containing protein [Aspergillus welwitschiae]RDH32171.1 kinesin-domain-containing protein [Aspergillus welwitschiae]